MFTANDHVFLSEPATGLRKFSHGYVVPHNAAGEIRSTTGDEVHVRVLYIPGIRRIPINHVLTVPASVLKKFPQCTEREKFALLTLVENTGRMPDHLMNSVLQRAMHRLRNKGYVRRTAPPHVTTVMWILNAGVSAEQMTSAFGA